MLYPPLIVLPALLALALLNSVLPEARATDCWGRLANPGFDGQRIKTTLFFAGQANDGSAPYGCFTGPNLHAYTLNPVPRDAHLNWANPANRDFVLNQMVDAGINVISMSSWGEDFLPCTDGWVTGSAPMQTSAQAQDELFAAANNKPLLIVPFIETRGLEERGDLWAMRYEFPRWTDGRVAPGLVSQIINLIRRYVQRADHPEWADKWAKVYDHNGTPRYAVVLIHAASNRLDDDEDAAFAAGFDLVADEVARATGVQVGFFIDAIHPDARYDVEFKPSPDATGPYLRSTPSFLGIQCFIPEIFLDETEDGALLAWKIEFIREWFSTGVPVLVDVAPGYDARLVFPESKWYGYSDQWLQTLTALVNDYGRAGMVYNSWNGYTEGMAAMPTVEHGNALFDWLKALNSNQGIHVDHNFGGAEWGTVSQPFRTVAGGSAQACKGDVVYIRSGDYSEAITISKPLTLQTEGGPVTIGR